MSETTECPKCHSNDLRHGEQNLWCNSCGYFPIPFETMPEAKHEWIWDWPWFLVDLRDWFYMVNTGYIPPFYYYHVRILGLRSLWKIRAVQIERIIHDTKSQDTLYYYN